VVPQFDIKSDPLFLAQQDEIRSLRLDRNQRRLSDIDSRLKGLLNSGRINKAVFDKLVPSDTALQFDQQSSIGAEFDSQCERLEWALQSYEQLPANSAVNVQRQTIDVNTFKYDDHEGDEEQQKQLDKNSVDAIESACPQFSRESYRMDPNTGRLVMAK